jgi:hypothetical protein
MRVDLKDGRSYLVERLYELPRGDGEATHTGLHRAAHCQGSHLPGNMLLSALYDLGEIGEDADAGCWADGVRELDARRARAAEALTRSCWKGAFTQIRDFHIARSSTKQRA